MCSSVMDLSCLSSAVFAATSNSFIALLASPCSLHAIEAHRFKAPLETASSSNANGILSSKISLISFVSYAGKTSSSSLSVLITLGSSSSLNLTSLEIPIRDNEPFFSFKFALVIE